MTNSKNASKRLWRIRVEPLDGFNGQDPALALHLSPDPKLWEFVNSTIHDLRCEFSGWLADLACFGVDLEVWPALRQRLEEAGVELIESAVEEIKP